MPNSQKDISEVDKINPAKIVTRPFLNPNFRFKRVSDLNNAFDRLHYIDALNQKFNPYPAHYFHEPTHEEWQKLHEVLKTNGISPANYFASLGRRIWSECVETLREEFRELYIHYEEEKRGFE